MQNLKEFIMTKGEYEELLKRQDYLVTVRRNEVAENLKMARGFGDLSENAEYDDAKNEQAILEAEISNNEIKINNARVIEESEIDDGKVHVGSRVVVFDNQLQEEMSMLIVGSASTDPFSDKVSRESPIGAALLGKEAGDTVDVETPGGIVALTIKSISRDKD